MPNGYEDSSYRDLIRNQAGATTGNRKIYNKK